MSPASSPSARERFAHRSVFRPEPGPESAPRNRRAAWRAGIYALLALTLLGVSLSGCAERLFYHPVHQTTPAPTEVIPHAEKVFFSSGDGTRLCGWFLPSTTCPAREAATVVHLHGNAGSMLGHRFFVDWLPAHGFNVFMFDYRGYGESEGAAHTREDLVADARAALAAVRARPDIDPARVAVFAQSLGGAIAAVVAGLEAAEEQAVVEQDETQTHGAQVPGLRALVLESPFASWRDVAANAVGGDPPNIVGRFLAWLLIRDEVDGVPRPEDAIALVECPVLIVHGDADSIVPVSHGRRLAAAAKQGVLVEFNGGEHNSLQDDHPRARQVILEFLREHTRS